MSFVNRFTELNNRYKDDPDTATCNSEWLLLFSDYMRALESYVQEIKGTREASEVTFEPA